MLDSFIPALSFVFKRSGFELSRQAKDAVDCGSAPDPTATFEKTRHRPERQGKPSSSPNTYITDHPWLQGITDEEPDAPAP